ncbi:MAG: universal stress protein [Proteobacteria bacterium]|nr:universal stress protein [Pseudomonadota bacterium]
MSIQMRRILVAIGDLAHPPKSELRKAGLLARKSGAKIELFHAITDLDPGLSFPEAVTARAVAEQRSATATQGQQKLLRMARDRSLHGLEVTCTASWDFPPHEAIIRRARTIKADLVIAATRRHRLGARMVLTNTDWELIRHCPTPVLLVKSRRLYRNPVVIAAVDPFHAHVRPADLDKRLVDAGAGIAKLIRGRLDVFHAYMPLLSVAPMAGATPVMLPPEMEITHEDLITREVRELAQTASVPAKRCHLCMGSVSSELDATVRRTHAHLVVMGAVSRSAVSRLFIGNTAERVLDRLTCDVLVIKPRGFKSKVVARRAVEASAPRVRARPLGPVALERARIRHAGSSAHAA